jgi:hypothetical protein
MDVIVFLCVSLGSTTVQRHGNLGNRQACLCSENGFSSQNGARATKEQCSVVRFLFVGKMTLNAKDIHKENFMFTVGSVCRIKQFTTGSRNFLN